MPFIRKLAWKAVKTYIRRKFPRVRQLSTEELTAWLEQKEDKPLLLDARTAQEYSLSHLPNAHLVPSFIEELRNWEEIEPSTPIVASCSVGYRSSALAKRLQEMGFENVFNLEGSIFQWANEERPVYQDERIVKLVHPYNRLWGYLLRRELHPDGWRSPK